MKNNLLIHPDTGSHVFARISDVRGPRGFTQSGGEIVLKHGDHRGRNRGFGAVHIWEEHSAELAEHGFITFEDVPRYVAAILLPGTPVHCEFSQLSGDQRLTVVRSTMGTAVLQYWRGRNEEHYSVVTAFSGRIKHGPRVGTVLEACEQ